jgi:hypothetical protein
MRTSLRRSLATAAAVTLLTSLAACGGDDGGDATGEPTTATSDTAEEPEATAEESEADDSADDEGADEGAADGEEISADEFLDTFRDGVENSTTGHMTMTTGFSGMSIDAEGDVDYRNDPPSMAVNMTIPSMGGEIDMRFVEGIFYMNMGQASQNKFIKLDPADPNSPMGDIGELTESMDPVRSFEQFAAGLDKVVYLGEEDIDGESTDHYVLTLDTTKIESLEDAGTAGIPKELDYDIWLDDENRMRQVLIDMGTNGQVDMSIEDWGQEVEIEAPAANEIVQMPQG